jgi:hypothetical protein
VLDEWAYKQGIRLRFIRPGKPVARVTGRCAARTCLAVPEAIKRNGQLSGTAEKIAMRPKPRRLAIALRSSSRLRRQRVRANWLWVNPELVLGDH